MEPKALIHNCALDIYQSFIYPIKQVILVKDNSLSGGLTMSKEWNAFSWKPDGEKCPVRKIEDGNGIWVHYLESDGSEMARVKYENGYKRRKTNYKEGKRDGLSTNWYKNGQKSSEESFKNEKLMTAIVGKPKGEKCTATNIKGGNGVKVDAYYEDGTEVIRSIYKDGSRLEDSALSP